MQIYISFDFSRMLQLNFTPKLVYQFYYVLYIYLNAMTYFSSIENRREKERLNTKLSLMTTSDSWIITFYFSYMCFLIFQY